MAPIPPPGGGPGAAAAVAAVAAAALLFCAPALLNGFPLFFPDSTAYLADGNALIRLERPNNVRSIFYGLAIWFLHWERTVWPIVLAQGAVLAHLLWLTLRTAAGVAPRPMLFLGIAALLAALTPLPWYVSHIMPDIFAPVTILALFLLGCVRARLHLAERAWLVLLGAAAASFHLTHLAMGLAIGAALAVAWLLRKAWRARLSPPLAALPVLLALAALLTASTLLWGRPSLSPKSPPFLLARLIADGPALAYLEATCNQRHWMLCRYRTAIAGMSEDDFLWRFLHAAHRHTVRPDGTSDVTAIRAQVGDIVRGTIETYPAWVAASMLRNAVLQLLDLRAEIKLDPDAATFLRTQSPYAWDGLMASAEGRLVLTQPAIAPMNRLHEVVAALGATACIPLAFGLARRRNFATLALLATVLLGMVTNAAVAGGLSGVFGRYQGRIVWLLPFWALLALWLRSLVPTLAEARADMQGPAAADPAPGR